MLLRGLGLYPGTCTPKGEAYLGTPHLMRRERGRWPYEAACKVFTAPPPTPNRPTRCGPRRFRSSGVGPAAHGNQIAGPGMTLVDDDADEAVAGQRTNPEKVWAPVWEVAAIRPEDAWCSRGRLPGGLGPHVLVLIRSHRRLRTPSVNRLGIAAARHSSTLRIAVVATTRAKDLLQVFRTHLLSKDVIPPRLRHRCAMRGKQNGDRMAVSKRLIDESLETTATVRCHE